MAVTRFQVMAVLQAARAVALGLSEDEAKSWGLNRALFYAAAKRGWENARAVGARRPVLSEWLVAKRHHDPAYVLGGEKAFRARDLRKGLRFKFGDEIQQPAQFDERVIERFDDWDTVWAEAMAIIAGAPRRDLDIQSRFFNNIYKPRRDTLARRWSRMRRPTPFKVA
jgi:hypothetical protein